MIDARLTLALSAGGLILPQDGQIAIIGPPMDARLADLPKHNCIIVERFKPAHDQWAERGFDAQVAPEGDYAGVIVCLPRSKTEARALIARAMMMTRGPVVIDGQKTDGVDSLLKEMRLRIEVASPISKAHGKLFWCAASVPDAFADWQQGPALTEGGFWTAPGVFSADDIDPASALLAAQLPQHLGRRVADLGAGWGYLSAHVLTRPTVEEVHLVEADHMALECARRNVTDPRAQFHWADATDWRVADRMDAVVMNPPFHISRAADPKLGQAFVDAAARILVPSGQLWMVANRHLPYEQVLAARFAKVTELAGDTRFKLFHAARPKREKP